MEAQSEYLEEALGGEDADEAHVEVLQSKDPHLGLTIVIQSHGEHVETNEDHDDHVKLFVCHDSKNNRLRSPLKHGKKLNIILSEQKTYFVPLVLVWP